MIMWLCAFVHRSSHLKVLPFSFAYYLVNSLWSSRSNFVRYHPLSHKALLHPIFFVAIAPRSSLYESTHHMLYKLAIYVLLQITGVLPHSLSPFIHLTCTSPGFPVSHIKRSLGCGATLLSEAVLGMLGTFLSTRWVLAKE